jgi:hypothetical protein
VVLHDAVAPDSADLLRWELPAEKVLSHAEVSPGRRTDMQQQAPAIREMAREALRKIASRGAAAPK